MVAEGWGAHLRTCRDRKADPFEILRLDWRTCADSDVVQRMDEIREALKGAEGKEHHHNIPENDGEMWLRVAEKAFNVLSVHLAQFKAAHVRKEKRERELSLLKRQQG